MHSECLTQTEFNWRILTRSQFAAVTPRPCRRISDVSRRPLRGSLQNRCQHAYSLRRNPNQEYGQHMENNVKLAHAAARLTACCDIPLRSALLGSTQLRVVFLCYTSHCLRIFRYAQAQYSQLCHASLVYFCNRIYSPRGSDPRS